MNDMSHTDLLSIAEMHDNAQPLSPTLLPRGEGRFEAQMDCHPSTQSSISPELIVLCDEERQPCEVWTRVMGYHRPVSSFNIGKKGEFHERTFFEERRASLAD